MKPGVPGVLCVLGLVALCSSTDFSLWTKRHGKVYSSPSHHSYRKGVWMKNMAMINQHNARFHRGEVSYDMAMNHHGDQTLDEIRSRRLCLRRGTNSTGRVPKVAYKGAQFLPPPAPGANFSLPDNMDFSKMGYVTPIKDQGQCGSCWTFSTTGAIEGQMYRKTGTLPNLSEQQLVDCAGRFGNAGCDGGLMDMAMMYVMKAGGLVSEEDYPYQGVDGQCQYKHTDKISGSVGGYMYTATGDEPALTTALALNGPLSIAIDASQSSFQFYSSGVYDEPGCSSTELDHGVLLVGYGVQKGVPYYLVKNSWGTAWGEAGFIKMSRNGANQCGVASEATLPLPPADPREY